MTKDQVRSTEEALKLALEFANDIQRGNYKGNTEEIITAIKQTLNDAPHLAAPVATNCRHCGGPDNVLCAGQCKPAPVQEPVDRPCCGNRHHKANHRCNGICPMGYTFRDTNTSGALAQKPVAWAIFTETGNTRMWSTLQPHVQMLADAEGLTVTPLYTTPPAAQPAPVQEPVFELQESGWEIICDLDWIQTLPFGTKLYTTPPAAQRQWVGLTEDELVEACPDNSTPMSLGEAFVVYGRAIEAKLREKNGGAA